jgi:hypothetical protein
MQYSPLSESRHKLYELRPEPESCFSRILSSRNLYQSHDPSSLHVGANRRLKLADAKKTVGYRANVIPGYSLTPRFFAVMPHVRHTQHKNRRPINAA